MDETTRVAPDHDAPSPAGGTPHLRVFGPEDGCREYLLGSESLAIGRARDVDVRLVDDTVSRYHAFLFPSEKGYTIKDNKSRRGTVLNGVAIAQASLRHGDTLQVGDYVIQFRMDAPARGERNAGAEATATEEYIARFRRLPSTMRVRYRVIQLNPAEAFNKGDTVHIGCGGILLPVSAPPPKNSCLDMELYWPDGDKRSFLGEVLGAGHAGANFVTCIKLHRVDPAFYRDLMERCRRGEWEIVDAV